MKFLLMLILLLILCSDPMVRSVFDACALFGNADSFAAQVNRDDDRAEMPKINPRLPRPFKIDEERVAASGIRKLIGKHLILYTDVRDRADIDELTTVFDLAVPQWCEHFSIDPQRTEAWQMRAFVMEDQKKFSAAGLIPNDLPEFPAGYQRGPEMWTYLQPGDYYSRHLLLHEGTHAFMEWFLDGMGAPWYSEGMAEWLGLNEWTRNGNGKPPSLIINHHVRDRDETPYWGRVKVIRDDWAADRALSLTDVLNIRSGAFRDVRYYGWSWAGCEFLSQHELSQAPFADFYRQARLPLPRFNARVQFALKPNIESLSRDWLLFISEMDYGIEVARTGLIPAAASPQNDGAAIFTIQANHGWQSTTLAVKAGERWQLNCDSRFVVGSSTVAGIEKPWVSAANGISLEYYRGEPLGILLAGVYDPDSDEPKVGIAGLLQPLTVGLSSVLKIETTGLLCLRINDSPARMTDNQGALEVRLEKLE